MYTRLLKYFLCFQLAFAPSIALAGDKRQSYPNEIIKKLSKEISEGRNEIDLWSRAADLVKEGRFSELPYYDNNVFQLANQRIEVVDEGVFSLNDSHLELPPVTFTGLKVVYDEESRELIFEGYQGLNERGENGKLMARQIIPDMDIASMTKDEEIIHIVDSKGNLHAIDMGYVSQSVFKSLIPVTKHIWEPLEETEKSEYAIRMATYGTRPPRLDEVDDSVVLPINDKGEVDIRAGDAMLYRVNASGEELVGIFSRQTTYEYLNITYEYLYKILKLVYPSNLSTQRIEALKEIDEHAQIVEKYEKQIETLPPVVRKALRNFGEEQVFTVFGPVKAYDVSEETGSYKANENRAVRNFQQLKVPEWVKTFEELHSVAVAQSEELVQLLGNKELSEAEKEKLNYQKEVIDEMIANKDFSTIWKSLYKESELNLGAKYANKSNGTKRKSYIKKLSDMLHLKKVVPLGATLGVIWGFPMAYEASESMQQVQVLSWMYQNFFEVVKDAGYRMPLLASTIALLAIWPSAVAQSWSIGKGLKLLAASMQKSTSVIGRTIRDLRLNWADLTNWQRITSFGMRFFGTLIYPIGRILISDLMRQPGVVSALSARLNPFQKIDPETALGKELGLTKPMTVGLSNPFRFGKSAKSQRKKQIEAQSLMSERKQRVENMSWILAATLVAEQEGVDAATIEMVAKGQLDPNNLKAAFQSKETKRQWVATQERIRKYLDGVSEGYFNSETGTIDAEQIDDFYNFALEVAKSLKGQNKNEILLKNLWANSRKALHKSTDIFFNFGLADSKFLRTVYTNKAVSEQTERGFVSDHIMVALIYALIGERADLSEPHNLSADPDGFLWTSGPHWSDIMLNTYAHFFAAGSKRALIYQSVKPENSTNYLPEEYIWSDEIVRKESFKDSSTKWVKNVADTRKSNLGYFGLKGFIKRFNTIWAGVYMNVAVRMGMGDQTLLNALMGFGLFFLAGTWFYGWPWDIIDRGAVGEHERMEENKAEFNAVLSEISDALRDENQERSEEAIRKSLNQLMGLYEKSNPEALKVLEILTDKSAFKEVANIFDEDSMITLGLAAQIQLDGDNENLKEALLTHISNSDSDKNELRKLSAKALQEYALKELPIFNEAHPAVSWFATAVFGAVGTTIMAIPLSVYSFDDSASAAARAAEDPNLDPNDYYLKPQMLAMWALISAVGFTAYYKVLGKDGYWGKLLDRIEAWKKKRGKSKSCDDYFTR